MGWLIMKDMRQALPLMLNDIPMEEAEAWTDKLSIHKFFDQLRKSFDVC